MYNKVEQGHVRDEYFVGLEDFIAFAVGQDEEWKDGDNIRCPCVKCQNMHFRFLDLVTEHLVKWGFMDQYWNWVAHGEPLMRFDIDDQQSQQEVQNKFPNWGNYDDMR